jgi:hypothetical protein
MTQLLEYSDMDKHNNNFFMIRSLAEKRVELCRPRRHMGNRRRAASCLISAVHEDSGPGSHPDRYTPWNESPVPTEHDAG